MRQTISNASHPVNGFAIAPPQELTRRPKLVCAPRRSVPLRRSSPVRRSMPLRRSGEPGGLVSGAPTRRSADLRSVAVWAF